MVLHDVSCRSGLFREKFVDELVHLRIFANERLYHLALWRKDNLCWEALDRVFCKDVAALIGPNVKPRKLMLCHGIFPAVDRIVAVYAQNLEFILVLCIASLHVGNSLYAPSAPRAPEIDDHPLATQATQRQRLTVDVDNIIQVRNI